VEAGSSWRRADAERRARLVLELALAAAGAERPDVPEVAARPWDVAGT
jgi:hypothetical protein